MSDKPFVLSPPATSPLPTPDPLFALPAVIPPAPRPALADPKRGARLREAERSQIRWGRIDLDAQLAEEHPARAIWSVVERLNLSALYQQIEARDQVAGASAIDPKILLALWVYATSEGEGSAREIWRLTEVHAAYRWLCGGVEVGYQLLEALLGASLAGRGLARADRGIGRFLGHRFQVLPSLLHEGL
jgi:hypothetical protein